MISPMMYMFHDILKMENSPSACIQEVCVPTRWMDDVTEREDTKLSNGSFNGMTLKKISPSNLLSAFLDEDSGLGSDEISDTEDILPQIDGTFDTGYKSGCDSDSSNTPVYKVRKRPLEENSENDQAKKRKQNSALTKNIRKCFSFEDNSLTHASDKHCDIMMSLVSRLSEDSDVIGDGSKKGCLSTIPGSHPDLKSISVDTVANLLRQKHSDIKGNFQFIDCRYPYEFEGGHIPGAINLYRQEDIPEFFQTLCRRQDRGQHILIFYCEFSSERGPKMYRAVRGFDREMNKEAYPRLNYPEIYLVHGGYKSFYAEYQILCEPQSYKPMLHKDHTSDLRHFRCKSKSWSGGIKKRRAQKMIY